MTSACRWSTIPMAHSRRLQPVAAAAASGAGVTGLATGVAETADGAGSSRATTASAMADATSVVTLSTSATSRSKPLPHRCVSSRPSINAASTRTRSPATRMLPSTR